MKPNSFRDKSKLRITRWSARAGVLSLLLSITALVLLPQIAFFSITRNSNGTFEENFGILIFYLIIGSLIIFLAFISSLIGLTLGIIAFRKGERSRVLWVGIVPSVLFLTFISISLIFYLVQYLG